MRAIALTYVEKLIADANEAEVAMTGSYVEIMKQIFIRRMQKVFAYQYS